MRGLSSTLRKRNVKGYRYCFSGSEHTDTIAISGKIIETTHNPANPIKAAGMPMKVNIRPANITAQRYIEIVKFNASRALSLTSGSSLTIRTTIGAPRTTTVGLANAAAWHTERKSFCLVLSFIFLFFSLLVTPLNILISQIQE